MSMYTSSNHPSDLLLEQFKGTDLAKLVNIRVNRSEQLFTEVGKLSSLRNIDECEGTQLDALGEIFGRYRKGNGDTVFRQDIKFKIGLLVADGTIEHINTALRYWTDTNLTEIIEVFPATLIAFTAGEIGTLGENIAKDLKGLVCAGVNLILSYHMGFLESDMPFVFENEGGVDDFVNYGLGFTEDNEDFGGGLSELL